MLIKTLQDVIIINILSNLLLECWSDSYAQTLQFNYLPHKLMGTFTSQKHKIEKMYKLMCK